MARKRNKSIKITMFEDLISYWSSRLVDCKPSRVTEVKDRLFHCEKILLELKNEIRINGNGA